jgi:hypothetical protein
MVSFNDVKVTSLTKSFIIVFKVELELVVTSGVTTLKAVPSGNP